MKIVWALIGAICILSTNVRAADAGQIEEGKQVYQYWCWNCHGEGAGKPGTAALTAKYKGSKPAILDQRTDLTPALTKVFVRVLSQDGNHRRPTGLSRGLSCAKRFEVNGE
jgi:mono/diheme cytochrome c family protein